MRTETTVAATCNAIASKNGTHWLTTLVCVVSLRSAVTGIVIVVIAVNSLL
jgi:hypothetical protein